MKSPTVAEAHGSVADAFGLAKAYAIESLIRAVVAFALADRDGKQEPAKCGGMCHGRKRVGRGWADDEPCPACNGAGLAPGAGAKTLDAGTGADGVCAPAGDVLTAGPAPVPVHLLELSNSCGVVCGFNGSLCRRVSRHGGKHRAKLDDETIIEWRKAPSPPPEPSPRHSEGCPLRKGNYTTGNCTCSAYPAPSDVAPKPSPRGMPEASEDDYGHNTIAYRLSQKAIDTFGGIEWPAWEKSPGVWMSLVRFITDSDDAYVIERHKQEKESARIEPRGGTGASDEELEEMFLCVMGTAKLERKMLHIGEAATRARRALYNAGRASRDATVDEFIEWVRAWCHSPNEMSKAPDRIAELRKELEKR